MTVLYSWELYLNYPNKFFPTMFTLREICELVQVWGLLHVVFFAIVAPKALLQKVGDIRLGMESCSQKVTLTLTTRLRSATCNLHSTLSFQTYIKSINKSACGVSGLCGRSPHPLLLYLPSRPLQLCPVRGPQQASSMCRTQLPGFSPSPD